MKKHLLFVTITIFSINVQAQDPQDSISDFVSLNPFEVADSMMSQLDFSSVTTNLLLDRSLQYTPLKGYDGSLPTPFCCKKLVSPAKASADVASKADGQRVTFHYG